MKTVLLLTLSIISSVFSVENSKDSIRDKLLADRMLFIGEPIDDIVANKIIQELEFLNNSGGDQITIYINSPGGLIKESVEIANKIKLSKAPVTTVCIGNSSGTATMILSVGKSRFALAGTTISLSATMQNDQIVAGDVSAPMTRVFLENTKFGSAELMEIFKSGLDLTLDEWIAKGVIDKIIVNPPDNGKRQK